MKTFFSAFAAAALALFLTGSGSGFAATVAVEIKPTDMVHGSPNAPVTMVEYASMTCPHCAAFQTEILPRLTKDYIDTGKVKLVFREYPLDAGARMASALARCLSGDQYFRFVDLLFRSQNDWWVKLFSTNQQVTRGVVEASLANMAKMAGMTEEKAKSCMNDPKNLDLVDASWKEAMARYKVNSTPSFIVNGTPYEPMTYDQWKAVLDPLTRK